MNTTTTNKGNTMTTTTDMIGTCGVCLRSFTANRGGMLAKHGYTRPRWGWESGRCIGSGELALAISPRTLELLRDVLVRVIEDGDKAIAEMPDVQAEALALRAAHPEAFGIRPSHVVTEFFASPDGEKWKAATARVVDMKRAIHNRGQAQTDLVRVHASMSTWQPGELVERRKDTADDGRCAGSGTYSVLSTPSTPCHRPGALVRCPTCQEVVGLTGLGKLRKHNPKASS
jgi:hypothetical protein